MGGWSSPPSTGGGGGSIAPLVVESANVVAQRNSTNAQISYVYGTYTDASNYSRVKITHAGGTAGATIATEALGTGTAGPLTLDSPASIRFVRSTATTGANVVLVGGSSADTASTNSTAMALSVLGIDGSTQRAFVRYDGNISGNLVATVDNSTAGMFQSGASGMAAPFGLRVGNAHSYSWSSSTAYWGSADVSLVRIAAKVMGIRDGSTGGGVLALPGMTVASLPTASAALAGALATVTDATVTTAGTTVAGGGSNLVTVRSDGTNWKIMF